MSARPSKVFGLSLLLSASLAWIRSVSADPLVWQEAAADGPLLQSFWVVLVTSILFWGVGLLGQRMNNRFELDDHNIAAPGRWVRILGINPEKDRLYLRYGFIQIVGIIYLMSGLIAMQVNEIPDYDTVTAASFILFSAGVFVFILFDIGGRFKKAEEATGFSAEAQPVVPPVPAPEQVVSENPQ